MKLTKCKKFVKIILLLVIVLISNDVQSGDIYGYVYRYDIGGIPPGLVYSNYWPDTWPRVIKLVRPGGSVVSAKTFKISPYEGANYLFQSSENYVGFKLYALGVKQSGNMSDGTWMGILEITKNSGRIDLQMLRYSDVCPQNFMVMEGYGYPNPFGNDPFTPANRLYWDIPSSSLPVDGFIIERKESGTSNWQHLYTTGPNAFSYLDNTITTGIIYDYLIKSFMYFPINEPVKSGGVDATAQPLIAEIDGPTSLDLEENGTWYARTNFNNIPIHYFDITWSYRFNNTGNWEDGGTENSITLSSTSPTILNLKLEITRGANNITDEDFLDVTIGSENCLDCHGNSNSELLIQSKGKFCPALEKSHSNTAELLKDINLLQNYPNPFNPITQIKFALPTDQNVSLRIYNYLGQEISTIYKNKYLNAGYHEVNFDGSNLSSGVYMYILEGENKNNEKVRVFKKMFLLK